MAWGRGLEPRFSDPKSDGLPISRPPNSVKWVARRESNPHNRTHNPVPSPLGDAQTWSAVQDLNLRRLICNQPPQPLGQRRNSSSRELTSSVEMVGVAGFEPALSCAQGRRISRALLHTVILERNKGVEPFFWGWRPHVQPLYQFRLKLVCSFQGIKKPAGEWAGSQIAIDHGLHATFAHK